MDDFKTRVAGFFHRVNDEAVPTFDRATVAFYGVQNEKIVKDRTGVLLRIADTMFILTASHDLREIVQNNIPLYVGWNERTELPIPLHDSRFLTTEYESQLGERDVVRDVAAIKLGESAAKEILAGGRIPISLCDIDTNQDHSPALFVMFGFPQAWFRVDQNGPKCSPLIYLTGIYAGEHWSDAQVEYDPKVHLLLDFKQDALAANGQTQTLPGYEGIKGVSGCGIWRVTGLHGSFDNWRPDQCKLVAIQHRYYEKPGYLHTTWIRYGINRIFDDYPELRSAATIIYAK
jgi:hypothetical protein